jgi:hypothetical protein
VDPWAAGKPCGPKPKLRNLLPHSRLSGAGTLHRDAHPRAATAGGTWVAETGRLVSEHLNDRPPARSSGYLVDLQRCLVGGVKKSMSSWLTRLASPQLPPRHHPQFSIAAHPATAGERPRCQLNAARRVPTRSPSRRSKHGDRASMPPGPLAGIGTNGVAVCRGRSGFGSRGRSSYRFSAGELL